MVVCMGVTGFGWLCVYEDDWSGLEWIRVVEWLCMHVCGCVCMKMIGVD